MRSNGSPAAIITGVSSGIGQALAVKMRQNGWRVIGTARDVERARACEWPEGMEIAELDLNRSESITAFAEVVLAQETPDILVNNAGALQFDAIEDLGQTEIEALFQTNVLGPMQLTTALIPAFRKRGSGLIVNISSLSGIMLFPFYGLYGMTKHALEAMSETLWYELRPFGVRVKLVEPGFVETPIWSKGGADLISIDPSSPYASRQALMVELERGMARRTCAKAADQIWKAMNDDSNRLRYPICGAGPPALARRFLGPNVQMGVVLRMWMRSWLRP